MAQIEVLGVRDYEKTVLLKQNAEKALKQLHLNATVAEINDVDRFLSLKINGIPALIVNGKIAFEKIVPSVKEIVSYFKAKETLHIFYNFERFTQRILGNNPLLGR